MLPYSEVTWKGSVPAPPRKLNGGLYTGEPFAAGAAGANGPVVPEVGALAAHLTITRDPVSALSPDAPEQAAAIGYSRPGNNAVSVGDYFAPYDPKLYGPMTCFKDKK